MTIDPLAPMIGIGADAGWPNGAMRVVALPVTNGTTPTTLSAPANGTPAGAVYSNGVRATDADLTGVASRGSVPRAKQGAAGATAAVATRPSASAPTTPANAPLSANGFTHAQILIAFMGLMLGMFLSALDAALFNPALPTIARELGGYDMISWIVAIYLLTSTASTPLLGKLGDLYGRKKLLQFSVLVFALGSALGTFANTMTVLILARAIQGIGSGGLLALGMALVGELITPRERAKYQGYMGSTFALASVAGPVLGGFFTEHLSWRWAFGINIPLCALAFVIIAGTVKLPAQGRRDAKVDYLGATLVVGAVSCLIFGSQFGGNKYAWGSPQVIGLGVGFVALSVLFVVNEHFVAEPLLPLRLFRNRVFAISTMLMFITGMAIYAALTYLSTFLQVVIGASPSRSGYLLIPIMGGTVVGSTVSGKMTGRTGRYKIWPVVGALVFAAGLFLLSTMTASTSYLEALVYMSLVGIGTGFGFSTTMLATQNASDQRDLGVVSSGINFFRSVGGAVGVAAFGAILNNRLAAGLQQRLPNAPVSQLKLLIRDARTLAKQPQAVQDAVAASLQHGMHLVFLVATPIALSAFFVALKMPELPLRAAPVPSPSPEPSGSRIDLDTLDADGAGEMTLAVVH